MTSADSSSSMTMGRREARAEKWVKALSGMGFALGNFHGNLESGVALCLAANKLKPGSVKAKYVKLPSKNLNVFQKRERIAAFISACKGIGVRASDICTVDDLYTKSSLKQVVITLENLSATASKKNMQQPFSIGIDSKKNKHNLSAQPAQSTQEMRAAKNTNTSAKKADEYHDEKAEDPAAGASAGASASVLPSASASSVSIHQRRQIALTARTAAEEPTRETFHGLVMDSLYFIRSYRGYASDGGPEANYVTSTKTGLPTGFVSAEGANGGANPLQQWVLHQQEHELNDDDTRVVNFKILGGIESTDYTRRYLSVSANDQMQVFRLNDGYGAWVLHFSGVVDPATQQPLFVVENLQRSGLGNANAWLTKYPAKTSVYCTGLLPATESAPYDGLQLWTLEPADMEVVSVTFVLSKAMSTQRPHAVAQQLLSNGTDTTQTMQWTTSASIATESHFEHSVGVSVTAGISFETSVPFFAKGKVSLSLSTNYSYTWGQSTTITQTSTEEFPVVVPPHTTVQASAFVQQAVIDVPYTMTVRSKNTGIQSTSTGRWTGVHAYNIGYTLVTLDSNDNNDNNDN